MGKNRKNKKNNKKTGSEYDWLNDNLEESDYEKDDVVESNSKKLRTIGIEKIKEDRNKRILGIEKIKEDKNEKFRSLIDNNFKEVDKERKIKSRDYYKSAENFLVKSKGRKRLNPNIIAQSIIKEKKIICMNEELYIYDKKKGYYKLLSDHMCKVLIMSLIPEEISKYTIAYDIEDILRLIKIYPNIQLEAENLRKNKNLVNCFNGVYDVEGEKLLPHDPKYYFFNVINAEYNSNISKEKVNNSKFVKFLEDITKGDGELKRLLKQIVGYTLSSRNNMKKLFLLYGKGDTGKSIMLDLITNLIGEENVCNVELSYLDDKKYLAELFGKMLNVCQELPDSGIKDTGTIKALVNDTDKVICRPLYKQPFSFYNKCKIICATNNLPSLDNKSYIDNSAFFNRIVVIPFENVIPIEKQDRDLISKLKKEKEIVLRWAMDGLVELKINEWRFNSCKISEEYTLKYRNSESIIENFIEDRLIIDNNINAYRFKCDIVKEFKEFYKDDGRENVSHKELKYLHEVLINKYKVIYKKIHRDGNNKYGYIGIDIR